MRIFVVGILICSFFTTATTGATTTLSDDLNRGVLKKKIMIFTSKGGYGHLAACATLKNVLTDYDVTIVNPFEEIISSLDIAKKLSWGRWDGEECYNGMLRNGWIRTMNFFCRHPAAYLVHKNRHKIEKKLIAYFEQKKPDFLISTIPLINYPASCAAKQYNIPFLLVTLDADLTKWLVNLEHCTHPNFRLSVGVKTPLITQQLSNKRIPKSVIREIGNPLRKDFFEPKDTAKILQEWNLPANKPIIMLIRGGAGSSGLVTYVNTLLKHDKPLHLLVCVGRNEALVRKLNRLRHKEGMVTFSIIPFTTRIADLMFVTDLLISQPSPNTCNEAMHFGIPILIDKTSPTLFWEDATADIVKMHGIGDVFRKMHDLRPLVDKYIAARARINAPINNVSLFDVSIKKIVAEMFDKASVIKPTNNNIVNPA